MSTRRRRSAHAIVALFWALSLATAACAPVTTPPRAPVPFPTTWPAEMKEAIDDLPRVMPYRAKAPVLPGYHLEGRPQVPLILCGAGAFAFLYGLTAL